MPLPARSQATIGAAFALACFSLWGFGPVYFKAVAGVPPLEILAHRVVWSVVFLAGLLAVSRGFSGFRAVFKDKRTRNLLAATTLVIATNWLIFIWAVGAGRVLETSLGYYMNPLISVAFGTLFLKERLRPIQLAAVALAGIGVLNLTLSYGVFPWVALSLALLFAVYGLLRKLAPVNSLDALMVETTYLLPAAAAYLIWQGMSGVGAFLQGDTGLDALLLAAGPVTALPLLLFASAARRLTLSVIGLFQYLAPTVSFLLAVFVWNEEFTHAHFVTFLCIWGAIAIYSFESLRIQRRLTRLAAISAE